MNTSTIIGACVIVSLIASAAVFILTSNESAGIALLGVGTTLAAVFVQPPSKGE